MIRYHEQTDAETGIVTWFERQRDDFITVIAEANHALLPSGHVILQCSDCREEDFETTRSKVFNNVKHTLDFIEANGIEAYNAGFLGWAPLPKRDAEKEARIP